MNTALSIYLLERVKADGILSAAIAGRIFPDQAPKGAANPCLIYQLTSGNFESDLDGKPAADGEFIYQLRLYASTRLQANTLRERLRILLQGDCGLKSVALDATSTLSFRIHSSQFELQADTYEQGADDGSEDYGALSLWQASCSQYVTL